MTDLINKAKLMEIADNFLCDEFRSYMEEFVGFDAADVAYDLYAKKPMGLVSLVDKLWDYAVTGDYRGIDPEVEFGVWVAFSEFKASELFAGLGNYSRDKKLFKQLEVALNARHKLDPLTTIHAMDWPMTRAELAAVAGMTEESIRVAAYAQGEQKLLTNDDGTIEIEEARRWLTVKGIRYTSKVVYSWDSEPAGGHDTVESLARFLAVRAEEARFDVEPFLQALDADEAAKRELKIYLVKGGARPQLSTGWISPELIAAVSKPLRLSAKWLLEEMIDTIVRHQKSLMLEKIQSIPAVPEPMTIIRDSDLATAESIRQLLSQLKAVRRHELQKKPNSKMDGYHILPGKIAFTHEHSLQTQFIWCRSEDLAGSPVDAGLIKEYPSRDLDRSGNYGRHSGLKKYPELAYADLVKITVRTIGDLKSVLAGLGVNEMNVNI